MTSVAVATLAAVLPWRPAADAPPARAAPEDDPVRIMAMGDSITWGTGSSDGDGWREPLRARLVAAGYRVDLVGPLREGRGPDPDLAGFPGWRVDQLRGRAPAFVTTHEPDVILLHIGTNDLRRGERPRAVAQRLAGLVGELQANRPAAVVVLARLVPSGDLAVQRRIDRYNAHVTRLADRRSLPLADMSTLDPRRHLGDPQHPNDAGYALMARQWWRALAPLLRPPADPDAPA